MSEFDRYAREYRALLDGSTRLSGEPGEYFAEYKLRVLRERWSAPPGARILDYGCGIGMLTARLADAWPGCGVYGYDPSAESLRLAAEGSRGRGNVSLILDLAQGPEGYDLAVCANVLHHVPPAERASAVREAARRLSPGGRLALFEHNPYNPLTRRAVAICPFDEGVVLLPRRETHRLVRGAGLRIVESRYVVFFPRFVRALRPLEPALGRLPLGAQYFVLAEAAGRG